MLPSLLVAAFHLATLSEADIDESSLLQRRHDRVMLSGDIQNGVNIHDDVDSDDSDDNDDNDDNDNGDGKAGKKGKKGAMTPLTNVLCPAMRLMIKNALVPNGTCVTSDQFEAATYRIGLAQPIVDVFVGVVAKHMIFVGLNVTTDCFDMTTLDGNLNSEHFFDAGILDPVWNKERFDEVFDNETDDAMVGLGGAQWQQMTMFQAHAARQDDINGQAMTTPLFVTGILFDLFGETSNSSSTYGKVMKKIDVQNMFKDGKVPQEFEDIFAAGGSIPSVIVVGNASNPTPESFLEGPTMQYAKAQTAEFFAALANQQASGGMGSM